MFTLSVSTEVFWAAILGAYFVVFCGILALRNAREQRTEHSGDNWQIEALSGFVDALAPIWIGLFLFLLYLLGKLAWNIPTPVTFERESTLSFFSKQPSSEAAFAEAIRWHILAFVGLLTALGGLITLPLAMIRVLTTERQVKAAEEGLITDRINKAVEGLGAEKTVSRQRRNSERKLVYKKDDGGKPLYDEPIYESITEPNLEVRIGAIFALERIAQDSERDHIQIMEILCAYIQDNSGREHLASLHPSEVFIPDDALPKRGDWAKWKVTNMALPRSDIRIASRVLDQRSQKRRQLETCRDWRLTLQHVDLKGLILGALDFRLADLRRANLQGTDLQSAQLDNAWLAESFLQAADFSDACLDGASLKGALGSAANFRRANLRYADLTNVQMREAIFSGADLEGASFENAELRSTNFSRATIRKAKFRNATLSSAAFGGADLRGARLEEAALHHAQITSADMRDCCLDDSHCMGSQLHRVDLRNASLRNAGLPDATISSTDLRGASMQHCYMDRATLQTCNLRGAGFSYAKLKGVLFEAVEIDSQTHFRNAVLDGAAFQNSDLSHAQGLSDLLKVVFFDGSVILPGGITSESKRWPADRPRETLEYLTPKKHNPFFPRKSWEFEKAWRTWQRERHPATLPATDDLPEDLR